MPPPTTEAAPAGANFTMPDFVGLDLQTAQNMVQTYDVFLSKSHDLLGSRNQLVDSNWIVCDQNIPAGQQVTGDAEGLIDFGVVKREEACP
jgi:beta-lactam-binding protein with PASTA domain